MTTIGYVYGFFPWWAWGSLCFAVGTILGNLTFAFTYKLRERKRRGL